MTKNQKSQSKKQNQSSNIRKCPKCGSIMRDRMFNHIKIGDICILCKFHIPIGD
jgi:acetyl-CoA carboxylase beta subunit